MNAWTPRLAHRRSYAVSTLRLRSPPTVLFDPEPLGDDVRRAPFRLRVECRGRLDRVRPRQQLGRPRDIKALLPWRDPEAAPGGGDLLWVGKKARGCPQEANFLGGIAFDTLSLRKGFTVVELRLGIVAATRQHDRHDGQRCNHPCQRPTHSVQAQRHHDNFLVIHHRVEHSAYSRPLASIPSASDHPATSTARNRRIARIPRLTTAQPLRSLVPAIGVKSGERWLVTCVRGPRWSASTWRRPSVPPPAGPSPRAAEPHTPQAPARRTVLVACR